MMSGDSSVTPDELHAFADGNLPPDRLEAVTSWLRRHPDDAALVEQWHAQAAAIRARYGAVIDEPVPPDLDLNRLAPARWRHWRATAAVALLAAALGIGVGWGIQRGSGTDAAFTDTFVAEAADAHRLYVAEVRHPVEVPGSEQTHLVQWLSNRLGSDLRAPDLGRLGLTLVGGRLLPGPAGSPSAFLMYEAPSGDRFTISCAKSRGPRSAMRYREASRLASFYWIDSGLAYVVTGPAERKRLLTVAQASYEQFERPRAAGKMP